MCNVLLVNVTVDSLREKIMHSMFEVSRVFSPKVVIKRL